MESCPHCHFLMRDDAVECGVCHEPRVVVATDGLAVVDDVRVGAGHATGTPIAVMVLIAFVLVVGAAILAVSQRWI